MKFKTGDVVEVQGVVKYDEREDGLVFITSNHQSVHIEAEQVVLVHQGFAVGDRATYKPTLNEDAPYNVEIIAVHDKQAWVEGDWDGIVELYELKRPEPVETKAETEAHQPPLPSIGDAGILLPADDDIGF